MTLVVGKRTGQSGNELVFSVFFSFFLHAALVIFALLLYSTSTARVYSPPFYDVKLVGQPAEMAPTPSAAQPTSLPKAKPALIDKKSKPKIKVAAPKPIVSRPALNKNVIPELSRQKPKPAQHEDEVTPAKAEPAGPTAAERTGPVPGVPAAAPTAKAGRTEGVAVSLSSGDSKQLSSYSDRIRVSIERNWNPPPGVKGKQVKVLFRVLRSGRVYGDVNIEESSGNIYFDTAARRAILSSSPFPPMPEDFYKQYAEFSVHLAEKE